MATGTHEGGDMPPAPALYPSRVTGAPSSPGTRISAGPRYTSAERRRWDAVDDAVADWLELLDDAVAERGRRVDDSAAACRRRDDKESSQPELLDAILSSLDVELAAGPRRCWPSCWMERDATNGGWRQ
ncbi:hypothetical protein PIB30_009428 [Stylosanthes scabra]|uniref:Uncharacterized protein n=1 Tax=Stylosanthes scabra TaxID=79078 RepID=A0ABU6W389_9FABA|nr:hypothetical protein [Stylosanthes scabra]